MTDRLKSFAEFHRANPALWNDFVNQARRFKAYDKEGQSARDWLRFWSYRHYLNTLNEQYRMNNDFSALYSRLLSAVHPELTGVFEQRKSIYDDVPVSEWIKIASIEPERNSELTLF